MRRWIVLIVGTSLLLAVTGRLVAQTDAPAAVFGGRVDINVVTLNVSVVDAQGRPVVGLGPDDFSVFIDGEPVELTNFFAADQRGVDAGAEAAPAEPHEASDDPVARALLEDAQEPGAYLALVFDNASLEKRNRKRILEALEAYVVSDLPPDTRVMVASTAGAFRIVQGFTDDPATLTAALEQVADEDTGGDMVKSSKRMLERSIQSAQTVRGSWEPSGGSIGSGPGSGTGGGTGGTTGGSGDDDPLATNQGDGGTFVMGVDEDFGTLQGNQYLAQVNGMRQAEYGRIYQALMGMETALTGVAGLPGRKDVLWIGQDLFVRPGIDVYQVFYTKFEQWSDRMNIDRPEIWATEVDLEREFQFIASRAQAAGATIHVVDTSDRDRDAASADVGVSDSESFIHSDQGGRGLTGGYDLSRARSAAEGSQYIAGATGGSYFGGSRDFDRFFSELDALLGAWYSLGYRPNGPLDGSLHSVRVEVDGERGWRVRHHEKVANLSPYHHLADRAFSQLVMNEGSNPMRFDLSVAESAVHEEGKLVHTFRLVVPAGSLVFVPEEDADTSVAEIAVAVVAAEPTGNTSDPKLFKMPLRLPTERLATTTAAAASFKLVLAEGSPAVAVAIRDEVSGAVGSTTLDMP